MDFGTVLFYLMLTVYFFICAILVLVILGQEGKGGGLSGLVGSTMGETFGFSGAATTLKKWTRNFAIIFFAMSVILTFWGERISNRFRNQFLAETGETPTQPTGMPASIPPGGAPPAPRREIRVEPSGKTVVPAPSGATAPAPAPPASGEPATSKAPAPTAPEAAAPAAAVSEPPAASPEAAVPPATTEQPAAAAPAANEGATAAPAPADTAPAAAAPPAEAPLPASVPATNPAP